MLRSWQSRRYAHALRKVERGYRGFTTIGAGRDHWVFRAVWLFRAWGQERIVAIMTPSRVSFCGVRHIGTHALCLLHSAFRACQLRYGAIWSQPFARYQIAPAPLHPSSRPSLAAHRAVERSLVRQGRLRGELSLPLGLLAPRPGPVCHDVKACLTVRWIYHSCTRDGVFSEAISARLQFSSSSSAHTRARYLSSLRPWAGHLRSE